MTDWITHDSTDPPELAPAALVKYDVDWGVVTLTYGPRRLDSMLLRGDRFFPITEYRPLTDDEGHKLISAEGLEDWAVWVTTDEDGEVTQWETKPELTPHSLVWGSGSAGLLTVGPGTHRHPGDWRDSLYRAEGK